MEIEFERLKNSHRSYFYLNLYKEVKDKIITVETKELAFKYRLNNRKGSIEIMFLYFNDKELLFSNIIQIRDMIYKGIEIKKEINRTQSKRITRLGVSDYSITQKEKYDYSKSLYDYAKSSHFTTVKPFLRLLLSDEKKLAFYTNDRANNKKD